jgi:exo-1,4-beta-D-glucosaminidase
MQGTGVWREVSISQSGPVTLSAPRVTTDFEYGCQGSVTAFVRVDVLNSASVSQNVTLDTVIASPDGREYSGTTSMSIEPGKETTVPMIVTMDDPQIWWPAQWGSQPLYSLNVSATVSDGSLSDIAEPRSFGIRHVSSYRNGYNDTAFLVNGHPFLVLGAGYSADIFYRFDTDRARKQLQLVLDMGLNTIRLEGKQEHPELYELADEMGVFIMAGWECCDKWEGWEYNDEADGVKWTDPDYAVANASMLHEAAAMQTHPSFLAFLVGSDFWPDDRATQIYVDALNRYDWPNPIIASAAERGYPDLLGISGMKMDGPYDWVPNK